MSFIRFITVLAWRNLWRSKRRTWITVSSVIFAVLLAVAMESMNQGGHEQIIRNMVQMSSGYMQYQDTLYFDERSLDNTLEFTENIQQDLESALPASAYYVPRLESFVLVASGSSARAAMITGVDFEKEQRMGRIGDKLLEGQLPHAESMDVLIPKGIARRFELGIGDTLVVFGQGFQGMQAAGKFAVSGIIEFPLTQLNDLMVYLPLKAAQWLFVADDRLTSVLLMAREESQLKSATEDLQAVAAKHGLSLIGWKEMNPDLISALEFDKASGQMMTMILYVVIAFGIFGTILTMTLEREKEFGTMLSLGMHRKKLALVSLLETLLICALGVFGGLLIGVPITYYFKFNPIPLGGDIAQTVEQFGMEALLTFSTNPGLYIRQAVVVFVIAFVVASYPLWRVFTLDILKTIRS